MRTLLASMSLAAFAAMPAHAGDDVAWFVDYDKALAHARETSKDLLVEFTGSDWCPPCKALYKNVFSKSEFAPAVEASFVLVKLDFPNSPDLKAKVPDAERNRELQKEFEVEGFPSVFLMTHDGDIYSKSVGYSGMDMAEYVEFLETQRTTVRPLAIESKTLLAGFEAAEGDARLAFVVPARELMMKVGDSPLAARVAPIVRAGMESDPKDEKGHLSGGILALLKSELANDEEAEAAKALDADNKKGMYELVVLRQMKSVRDDDMATAALDALDSLLQAGELSAERAKEMLSTALTWSANYLDDKPRAEGYATRLRTLFPDDVEVAAMIEEALNG